MSSGTDFILRRPKKLSRLEKIVTWIKCYGLYKLKIYSKLCSTVAIMLIKREKRLYYIYSTSEVVTVTAINYIQLVKLDAHEYALLKIKTKDGFIYHKAERF